MPELNVFTLDSPLWIRAFNWLLTYWLHSTVLLGLTWGISRSLPVRAALTKDRLWRAGLFGAVVTASLQLALNIEPVTGFIPTDGLERGSAEGSASPAPTVTEPSRGERPATTPLLRHASTTSRFVATERAVTPKTDRASTAPGSVPHLDRGQPASGATIGVPIARHAVAWIADHAIAIGVCSWALLALAGVARVGAARWRMGRILARRRDVTDPVILRTIDELSRRADFSGRVRVTAAAGLRSPISFGRREICLPQCALTTLSPPERSLMLAHELGHLVRRDPLWLVAASLIERVFFFQPLNRIARRAVQEEAEYVCDDFAVRLHGGGGIDLASCLARVATWHQHAAPLVLVSSMFNGQSSFIRRVRLLLEGDRATIAAPSRAWSGALVGALALCLVAFVPRAGGRVEVETPFPVVEAGASSFAARVTPVPKRPHVDRISDGIVVYEENFEPGAVVRTPAGATLASSRSSSSPNVVRVADLRAPGRLFAATAREHEEQQRAAELRERAEYLRDAIAGRTAEAQARAEIATEEARAVYERALAQARTTRESFASSEELEEKLEQLESELERAQELLAEAREAGDLSASELSGILEDATAAFHEAMRLAGEGRHYIVGHDANDAFDYDYDHDYDVDDDEVRFYDTQELLELRSGSMHFDLDFDLGDADDEDVLEDFDRSELDDMSRRGRERLARVAVEVNDDAVLEAILDASDDFSAGEASGLLIRSVSEGNESVFDVLVDRNLGLDAVDVWGITPLHRAASEGESYMLERLLDVGMSVSVIDEHGRTALHMAAAEDEWEIVEILIDRGADPNATDDWGRVPIHYAAAEGDVDIVELLVDRGADVTRADLNGQTALHFAAAEGDYDVCEVLLDHGADPDVLDDNDRSAVDIAGRERHDEIVNLLLDHSREKR